MPAATLREHLRKHDEGLGRRAETLWERSQSIHDRQTLPDANENGRKHLLMVEQNIWRLIKEGNKLKTFRPDELFILSCGACCHDFDKGLSSAIGSGFFHGEGSGEYLFNDLRPLNFSQTEAYAIGMIIRIHDRKGTEYSVELSRIPEQYSIPSGPVGLRRLAVVLKAADILHTDSSRVPDVGIDVARLASRARAKHLARGCIAGWRREGARLVIDANPITDEQFSALLACQHYITHQEWQAIGDPLCHYGFPHQLEFCIQDGRPASRRLPSASSIAGSAVISFKDSQELSLPEIDSVLRQVRERLGVTNCTIIIGPDMFQINTSLGEGFLSPQPEGPERT